MTAQESRQEDRPPIVQIGISAYRKDDPMEFWMIPFVAVSVLILFLLSLVVVEYQEQRIRRYNASRRLR